MTRVTIERIATGGDGVGRLPDGMTVFVPRTVPGDEVGVEVWERRQRWARGRVRELHRSGAQRTAPRCPHYDADECGGCQLQHVTLEGQADAKRAIVRDVLRRVGGQAVDLPELRPAPSAWRYRTKVTLAAGPGGALGYHRYDRPGQLFALDDCHIARAELNDLLRRVRAASSLLPPGVAQVVLRLDRDGGLHLVVRGGEPPWDPHALAVELGGPRPTVWWAPGEGAPRVVAGDGGAFPALAFLQTHPALADAIRAEARIWLEPGAGRVVWDLYGGVGDGARALARMGAEVWSVDADRAAVAWAERQGAGDGEPGPRYVVGRVEEVLHRLPAPDAVVVNPPRGGLAGGATRVLNRLARRAPRLAYISCDPATLARDIRRLSAFRLMAVTAYDLFPQTAHVETLALLEAA